MKRLVPIAIFLTVALASALAAGYAYNATENASRIRFEAAADDAVGRISIRIEQHVSLLRATLAFFEASEGRVSRDAFRAFVETLELEERSPGLQGIGFASYFRTGEEAVAEAFIRREFGEAAIWPETDQDHRAAIVLLEPLDERNRRAIGYDMFSDPDRRAAMIQAIEAGEARSSGRVQLVQDGIGDQPGFLVYLPFHIGPGGSQETMPAGSQRGFVYAPFRASDLFETALGRLPLVPVAVEIYEGGPSPDRLLFTSATSPVALLDKQLSLEREMVVAGRRWVLRFQPAAAFAPASQGIPVAIGLFGLILAGAFAFGARLQGRAYEAVTQLHAASQKSLVEKDLLLQEMKHRIKNSITRMLAIARQTAAGSNTVDEFQTSFGARMQAMAASQDMLTRSRWQKADLNELIRIELEQVFGQNLDLRNLKGPQVEVGEAATQALGLTFHELATNALKYGDVGNGSGALIVEWRVEGRAPRRRLVLTWSESSAAPIEAPEKKGFGTRLIEANIVRELSGTIERTYGKEGLTIEITVPLL